MRKAMFLEGQNLLFLAFLDQNYIMIFTSGHYLVVYRVSIFCPHQKVVMYCLGKDAIFPQGLFFLRRGQG